MLNDFFFLFSLLFLPVHPFNIYNVEFTNNFSTVLLYYFTVLPIFFAYCRYSFNGSSTRRKTLAKNHHWGTVHFLQYVYKVSLYFTFYLGDPRSRLNTP